MANAEASMKDQYETNLEETDELTKNQKQLKKDVLTTKWKLEN